MKTYSINKATGKVEVREREPESEPPVALQRLVRRRERLMQTGILLLYIGAIATLAYHSLSFGVWQFRNPKANAMTFYSHYLDVMTWRKLPEFQ